MYKIIDNQLDSYFAGGDVFDTIEDVVSQLISYHDIDFTGVDENDNELSLSDYLKHWGIVETKEQLNWLLDYGEWEIERVGDDVACKRKEGLIIRCSECGRFFTIYDDDVQNYLSGREVLCENCSEFNDMW